MEKKRKITRTLFLFTILLLFSCSEDLYETENPANKSHSVLVQRKNFDDLKKDKKLIKSIEKFTLRSSNSFQKQYYDSVNNFYIDLDNVMFTQDSLNNQAYTFKIIRTPNNGLFENLILKTSTDGDFDAILAQYNQNALNLVVTNSDVATLNIIMQNVNFVYLGKSNLTDINSRLQVNNTCYEPGFAWAEGSKCAEGNHTFGQGANCSKYWGTSGAATSGEYVYTLVPVPCESGGGGISNPTPADGGFSTGPHQIGSGGSLQTPCEKVKKPFITVPTLKQRTQTLGSQTSQPIEKGFYMSNNANSTTSNPFTDLVGGTNGSVELPTSVSAPMSVIAHTHNSPANSTYSVPSWEDLDNLSEYIQQNPTFVDTENLVFIVITADGTRYALAINDYQTFIDFFYWSKFDIANYDYLKIQKKSKAWNDYYLGYPNSDPPVEPKIKENNTDKIQDLKHYLNMLQTNGVGIDVFEINSTYNTLTQVSYDPISNQIIRTNCN